MNIQIITMSIDKIHANIVTSFNRRQFDAIEAKFGPVDEWASKENQTQRAWTIWAWYKGLITLDEVNAREEYFGFDLNIK